MKHLIDDFGVTAWVATLIIIGSFSLLLSMSDRLSSDAVVGLVGGWVGGVLTTIGIIKVTKKKK